MKITRAKLFIRENDYNFTQIALLLGYDSIHSFSRQFKAVEGMSPREYAKVCQAKFIVKIAKTDCPFIHI